LSVMILLFYRLNYSKFGLAIYYLNHDHIAAKSVGIKPSLNKLLSFSLGTMLAGFTGAIYTLQYGAVSPEAFGIEQSILLFAVVIVGGQGSLIGVVAGSFVMFVLPEIFRSYAEYRLLVFGAAMVILMVIRPNGLFPSKFGFFQKRHLQQK
ncbi:MAG: high-affinity branched-chain amino acid transporter, permease protein, partial [Pseudomonadota bacterium]